MAETSLFVSRLSRIASVRVVVEVPPLMHVGGMMMNDYLPFFSFVVVVMGCTIIIIIVIVARKEECSNNTINRI